MTPLSRAQLFYAKNQELFTSMVEGLMSQGWDRSDALEEVDIRSSKMLETYENK